MKQSLVLIREKDRGSDNMFYLYSENMEPENSTEENSIYLKKILIG